MRLFILALTCLSLPANADQIDDFCNGKWSNDFEMLEYCIDNQREAAVNVQKFLTEHNLSSNEVLRERYEAKDPAAIIFGECMGKWSTDYEMLHYCLTNQSAAAERLGRLPSPEARAAAVQMRSFDFAGEIERLERFKEQFTERQ